MPAILAGIGWHMVGAASAASFYAPIAKVKKWSWETTWSIAGIFSWILLPLCVSFILLPDLRSFYLSVDSSVLWRSFLFGCMWGIGNVNYGLAMRYLGMSLGIGVAIGVTLVVGTLMPPILHGQYRELLATKSGLFTMAGILVALIGVALVSYAGHLKDRRISAGTRDFHLKRGLIVATMCGVFSSGMSFAIDAAEPMKASAIHLGVNPLYAALPSYVVIMGGGALINLSYCFIRLALKANLSLQRDLSQPSGIVLKNGCLAATGGTMWYFQFFFYAWGAANIPQHISYVNWMLHMSGYVLCGGLVGMMLGEWMEAGGKPLCLQCAGMAVIIVAANLVGLGMAS